MNPEALLELWGSLADGQGASGMDRRRLDTEACVDMFACIFWPSRRLGLLIEGYGEQHPLTDRIPSCRGVKVVHEAVRNENPRTILRVILEDPSLLDIFAVLSADLINATRAEQDSEVGLRRCIDRLSMWQGLFERVPPEGLSGEAQRGLFGELVVLENFCLPELDPLEAVTSWAGPDAAHQDFRVGDAAIEVKTTLAKRHARIFITNEKQLDERPHRVLLLALVRLDVSQAQGIALPTLVTRLRSVLPSDTVAEREFNTRLMLGGYLDVHAPLYERNRYLVEAQRYFHVHGDFPRLTEAELPPGVGDICYSIIADDLSGHEVKREEAAHLVRGSHDRA